MIMFHMTMFLFAVIFIILIVFAYLRYKKREDSRQQKYLQTNAAQRAADAESHAYSSGGNGGGHSSVLADLGCYSIDISETSPNFSLLIMF